MNAPFSFDALSPQQMQMMMQFMQMTQQPAPAPVYPPTPGPNHPIVHTHSLAPTQFANATDSAGVGTVHPNLEMASEVDVLRKEVAQLRESMSRKRAANDGDDGADDADDETAPTTKKAKKKVKEVKRHLKGDLNGYQLAVRSQLMVSALHAAVPAIC
jgi:hypothetical protein